MPSLVGNDINRKNYKDIIQGLSDGEAIKLSYDAERELGIRSTWYLGCNILGYDWLESRFHRAFCRFIDNNWMNNQVHLHPRGHLKTTIMTTKNIRRVLENPNWREGICANKVDNSSAMLSGAKSHFIHNKKFRRLYPEHAVKNKSDWGTTEKFTTPGRTAHWIQEATYEAFSIDTTVVSRHYDGITFDDICDGKNSRTANLREEVKRVFRETLSVLTPRGGQEPIKTIVGTRWHFDDFYSWILKLNLKKKNYIPFITQAYIEDAQGNKQLLFPEQFSEDLLEDLRETQGDYIFSCQYMNNPIPDGTKDLDPTKVRRYTHKEYADKNLLFFRYATLDPGGWDEVRGIRTADKTSIMVGDRCEDGNFYIREIRCGNWNPHQTINNLIEMLRKWHPQKIGIEQVNLQKILRFFLEDKLREVGILTPVEPIKRGALSKIERLERIIPYLNAGKINYPVNEDGTFDDGVKQSLIEMDEYPSGKSDDTLDNLADLIEISDQPYRAINTGDNYRRPSTRYDNRRGFQTGYGIYAGGGLDDGENDEW